jgi:xanthine dehydrogenase YagT iron-sulfur-binding subunit
VLVDSRRVNSCLTFAVAHHGADVRTVEGLAGERGPHPVQQAFLDRDAYQCGYCTPGQICSAVGMLAEVAAGWPSAVTAAGGGPVTLDDDEVRERMAGNLCRCGAYMNLVPAILDAAR